MLYILIAINIFKIKIGYFDFTLLSFLFTLLFHIKVFGKVRFINLKKKPVLFLLLTLIIYSYVLLITIISGALLLDELFKLIRFILSFLSICWCIDILIYKSVRPLLIISRVVTIHLFLCILQIIFPPINVFFQENFLSVGNFHWYRVTGIMNGTSSAGLFLGLCSVLWFYIYNEFKTKLEIFFLALSILIFPFTAITGYIVFFIGITGYLIARRNFKLISKFIVVISIMTVLVSVLYVTIDRNSPVLNKIGAVEVLNRIDALLGKESSTRADPRRSAEKLADTYKLPESEIQLILGNGYPSKHSEATTTSDAGIIGNIHSYGLIGLCLIMLSFIIPSIQFYSPLSAGLLLSYIVIFLKNDLTYSRIVFDFYLIVVMTIYYCEIKSYSRRLNFDEN